MHNQEKNSAEQQKKEKHAYDTSSPETTLAFQRASAQVRASAGEALGGGLVALSALRLAPLGCQGGDPGNAAGWNLSQVPAFKGQG